MTGLYCINNVQNTNCINNYFLKSSFYNLMIIQYCYILFTFISNSNNSRVDWVCWITFSGWWVMSVWHKSTKHEHNKCHMWQYLKLKNGKHHVSVMEIFVQVLFFNYCKVLLSPKYHPFSLLFEQFDFWSAKKMLGPESLSKVGIYCLKPQVALSVQFCILVSRYKS